MLKYAKKRWQMSTLGGLAQGLIVAASGEDEPVSEADVVAIVAQYEGVVDAAPFEMVAEPVFVEWRKIVILASLVALLVAMLIQSAFDGQCMKYSADGAKVTISGVYCWRDKDIFREYYRLSDLREKHEGPPVDLIIRPTPTFGQGL